MAFGSFVLRRVREEAVEVVREPVFMVRAQERHKSGGAFLGLR